MRDKESRVFRVASQNAKGEEDLRSSFVMSSCICVKAASLMAVMRSEVSTLVFFSASDWSFRMMVFACSVFNMFLMCVSVFWKRTRSSGTETPEACKMTASVIHACQSFTTNDAKPLRLSTFPAAPAIRSSIVDSSDESSSWREDACCRSSSVWERASLVLEERRRSLFCEACRPLVFLLRRRRNTQGFELAECPRILNWLSSKS